MYDLGYNMSDAEVTEFSKSSASVGLNVSDVGYFSIMTDKISNCLSQAYTTPKRGNVDADGKVPAACTKSMLFHSNPDSTTPRRPP